MLTVGMSTAGRMSVDILRAASTPASTMSTAITTMV